MIALKIHPPEDRPKNVVGEIDDDGLIVIIFISNINKRKITYSYVGYYLDGAWHYQTGVIAEGVSGWAYLPEPMTDEKFNKLK